ncbi:MAG: polyphosphate kinase 1, partial [Bdellovibrio sp.]
IIRDEVQRMMASVAKLYSQTLLPELRKNKIHLLAASELSEAEKEWAKQYFKKNVFPVLTPLAVDPGHPFPFISNLSTSLGLTLRHPSPVASAETFFARVKIPQVLPPWVRLETGDPVGVNGAAQGGGVYRFVSLMDIVRENLASLFPAMEVVDVMAFRVTRNAEVSHDEEDAEDLVELIEEELRLRRFAEVVRLVHGPHPNAEIMRVLLGALELSPDDVYEHAELLDYTSFGPILDLPFPDLKFPAWTPVIPPQFIDSDGEAFFSSLRLSDHLVHHPYESFSGTVEKMIRLASEDPKVLAIKMTLYRMGDNNAFVKSLIAAAEKGKQVVCLVEVKARFDEERNLFWAQELENAGVHVVYGIMGLKTHAKTALVVRREADGLRCYAHFGTGNYNSTTSRLYTDLGLLTTHPELTEDLVEFFHYLTGRSLKQEYRRLLIAPVNMFSRFRSLIDREAELAKAGKPAAIFAKMNNMEENDIGLSLYRASQAGVPIDLVVRGFCSLRPGLPKLSENLRVFSVVGRYLEHGRLFYFRNGAEDPIDGEFFIGSADWMYRNLHGRVECVVPILGRAQREKIWELIQLHLNDRRQTWDMKGDGSYIQRQQDEVGIQQTLMNMTKLRAVQLEEEAPT